MADLKFKDTDRTLKEYFNTLADYLENISGLDARDKAISNRLASIIKETEIKVNGTQVTSSISEEVANKLTEILTLPDKNGVEAPILSVADCSDPANILGAVSKFVEYRVKKEQNLKEINKNTVKDLYDTQVTVGVLTERVNELKTENAELKLENEKLNKNKKQVKPAKVIFKAALYIALGACILVNANLSIKNKNLASANSNLTEQNLVLTEENQKLINDYNISQAKAEEYDEIVAILNANGIDVTDIESVSDSIQKLFDDSYLTNDDAKQLFNIMIEALEDAGINIEELKDENGNYSVDKVDSSMKAFVNTYLQNLAELSNIQKTVDSLYDQAKILGSNGKNLTSADFAALGGEDGAIQYIVEYYSDLYQQEVENGVRSQTEIDALNKQLADLKKEYQELLEKYLELQNSQSQTPGVNVGGSENEEGETNNKNPVAEDEVAPEDSTNKGQQTPSQGTTGPTLGIGD